MNRRDFLMGAAAAVPITSRAIVAAAVCGPLNPALGQEATGPLTVCPTNRRYFTDGSGKAVYLTGSHTWANFSTDQGTGDPPAGIDYGAYLDFLVAHHHNFFRGWVWDLAYSLQGSNGGPFRWNPFPWQRTGPGNATDSKPKFDLSQYDQAYFDRLRARVRAARDRGIYVSIMLFQATRSSSTAARPTVIRSTDATTSMASMPAPATTPTRCGFRR